MKYYLFFLLVVGGTFSCKSEKEETTNETDAEQTTQWVFENYSYTNREGKCDEETGRCVEVLIKYPKAVAGNAEAMRVINARFEETAKAMVLEHLPENHPKQDIHELSNAFVKEYQRFIRDFRDVQYGWKLKLDAEIVEINQAYISIRTNLYTFSGGAHPNVWTYLASHHPETGEILKLSEIVQNLSKLTALGESVFRSTKQIPDSLSLGDSGYFFEDGFNLPDNFCLTDKSLIFYYNNYEIAPYAAGPTELVIEKQSLEGLLQKNL